ncbi:MAG: YihY/virulence factor BrkB family protein [Dermabacter sp.]|nr:YihY/virulence factor BrkB family protein [Dermabacter sp.]
MTAPPTSGARPKARLSATEWKYAAKRTLAEFMRDSGTDLAAQLTYFTVLAIAPAVLAIFSLSALLLSDFQEQIAQLIKDAIETSGIAGGQLDLGSAVDSTLEALVGSTASGTVALIIGILTAMWSASAYVKAFSRASNRIYGVEETRGPVPFNLSMFAVTGALLVGLLVMLISFLLSASLVEGLFGDVFGAVGQEDLLIFLADSFLPVWAWAKWPVLLVLAFAVVSLLYWATPNLKRPYRFISAGGVLAIVGLALATGALSIYMSMFAGYSSYGAIGAIMAVLFALWVMNIVVVLGAEFDAEIVRAHQLAAGEPAEDGFELPKRGEQQPTKKDRKFDEVVDEGREIRVANLHNNQERYAGTFAGEDAIREAERSRQGGSPEEETASGERSES